MKTMTAYDQQAADFLELTGIKIEKKYAGHRPYFTDDLEQRAVWDITIVREGKRAWTFTFGQSIVDSYKLTGFGDGSSIFRKEVSNQNKLWQTKTIKEFIRIGGGRTEYETLKPIQEPPTDYDILSILQKSDPGTFEDFIGDFGYSTDSMKAREIYLAVQKEWQNVNRLFGEAALRLLEEIT